MPKPRRLVAFERLSRVLMKERRSPRAVAILTAAHIDTVLENALRAVLIEAPSTDALFDGQRALATSAARIDVAFALGLFSGVMRRDLHLIRKIRNHFAHEVVEGSFDTEPVRSFMRQMSVFPFADNVVSSSGKPRDATTTYDMMCVIVLGFLEAELKERRRRPSVRDPILLHTPTEARLQQVRASRQAAGTAATSSAPRPSDAPPPRRSRRR
jgi:hypothetical protein